MGTALNTTFTMTINSTYSDNTTPAAPAGGSALGSVPSDTINPQAATQFTFGTGTNKAQIHFHGTWLVPNGGQTTFDLFGVLADVFGDQIDGAELKGIYIKNNNVVAGDRVDLFGNAAAGGLATLVCLALGDALRLGPGGAVMITNPIDGYAIATGATDTLEIDNTTGNDISCDVFFLIE